MKLDPRIKSLSDILTCFDTKRAGQFIGQKGYFSNDLRCFENLQSCKYGTLTAIICDKTDEGYAYLQDNNRYQDFFIPESSLKPIEKKYRPYTFAEFRDKIAIGSPVKFRGKGDEEWMWFILTGYRERQYDDKKVISVYIGTCPYTLDELFEEYEWQDPDTGDWKPIGVEVEE